MELILILLFLLAIAFSLLAYKKDGFTQFGRFIIAFTFITFDFIIIFVFLALVFKPELLHQVKNLLV